MYLDKYSLRSAQKRTVFEFTSEGSQGSIKKLIQFQETSEPNLYNLAFGDRNNETGEIDDIAVSNNGDSEKVLATVVSALIIFFEDHPEAFVYATGSTKSRTRLYRINISKFIEDIEIDFYLYGQIGDDFEKFELEKEYSGFLVQRKFH